MSKTACEALKLDNQLCFAIYATSLALGKLYKPLLRQLGLTYPQYLIMLVLWEDDGITLTELGRRLGQDLGALSPVIKRLETQALILRRRSSDDERKILLQLTEAGRELRGRAEAIPMQILCASGLDAKQAQQLKRQLDELRAALQSVDMTPVSEP